MTMPQITLQPSRPRAKTVLAVQMLVARTAWLDGRQFWRDGNVSWETAEESVVPDGAVLSRAQRHLNKIVGFPKAADLAVGDSAAWLSDRRERLELAKLLRDLPKPDIQELAQKARRRDPAVAVDLSRLLIAEALCLNALPESPCAALAALGKPAIPAIIEVLLDVQTPAAARALAALTLGAISRALDPREARLLPALTDPWQARAFGWGCQSDLPVHPVFVVTLLAESDEIARRGCRSVEGSSPPSLWVQMLRELLADGLPPITLVKLSEAANEAETVLERMRNVRAVLPDPQKQWDRRQIAETLRAERQTTIQALAEAVAAYVWLSRDPEVVHLITGFLRRMLALTADLAPSPEPAAAVLEQALTVTRMGLKLPPARQRDYWELLTEQYSAFWDPETLPVDPKPHRAVSKLRSWLHTAQVTHISPLRRLLTAAQDRATVAAIFDLGVQVTLAEQTWTDPDHYKIFVTLAADLTLKPNEYFVWELCRLLDYFPYAREARPYFQALFQPLRSLTPALRRHVFETLLDEAGLTRQAVRQHLPRMISLLPALSRRAAAEVVDPEAGRWCACGPVFAAALALVQSVPDQAKERLERLLSVLPATEWQKRDYRQAASLRTGLTLAVTLCANDAERFSSAVQAATLHRFRQEQSQVEAGLSLVKRFPALRQPLAHLFARQPQRVAELLVRLGLTSRLSTDIQPLLAGLEPQAAWEDMPGTAFPVFLHPTRHWWTLHQQMPDLTEAANAYRHAQWVLNQSQEMPAGVRRALDRPRRIEKELTHLEGVLAADLNRSGIAARVAKLRGLLEDKARLADEIGADVRERLPQVAAEAQFAAIESQVLACYRTRLEAVAGPLPPETALTEDLLNATLLTVDIRQNRKLLLHLLRAHLSGDLGWRERHPANQEFLASLTAHGVDTAVWLSEFPRRYSCAGVTGGRVHLRLEQDPLHVLQMGNHFGTCLSFGDVNSFSTVANACELNKRVLYARDSGGHVVGRKLLGITAEGEMVGFHTYCSLTDETCNQALQEVFRHYCTLFADRCRLPMADTGTVPTLFAEAWYDDYAVAWAAGDTDVPPVFLTK